MDRENYTFLEEEFNKQLAAKNAEIEKKYGALKAAQQSKAAITKIQTNDNLKIADQTKGVSEKEIRDTKKALAANVKSDTWFLEQEMTKEKEKFKKALEKEMWKDYGSRLQAREKALGPTDPEVMQNKKEQEKKAQQQKELQEARVNDNKTKLQAKQDFNKQAEQQKSAEQQKMKDQFQNKAGKSR